MEDSINPVADLEVGTTTSDSVADQTTSAPASAETSAPSTPRETVMRAFEKLTGEKPNDTPRGALPQLAGSTPSPAANPAADPITGQPRDVIKAPGSLSPAQREKWASLDPDWQKHFVERDKHIADKLQESAQERKIASEFREVAQPYEAMLRQHGTTATAHVKELFNLSHALNTGSPQTKAQVLAQLITHFQPDANALRAYLSGAPVPQQAQQAPQKSVDALVEEKLAAREQQAFEKSFMNVAQAFANDPKNEFFRDVQSLMEKAIDGEWVTGRDAKELLQNAYDFACNQHQGVKQALAMRTTAPAAAATAQARPTGSVKPSMGTGVGGRATAPKSMTAREAAAAAYDKYVK